ncbi:MAG: hypothetical protein Q9216_006718 [Gyalolechia sp. 2 TL-2023]
MEQANIKEAARLATDIRIRDAKLARTPAIKRFQTFRLSCKVVMSPLHGSHNILLPVRFRDGARWLLKIPANGSFDRWDEQSARSLASEVLTMKLIYNNSSVPVPRIYGFGTTSANPIRTPFILMEKVEGYSLFYGWFYTKEVAAQKMFRERAMASIATAMVQLSSFTFSQAGALQYNIHDKTMDVGAYRKVDHFAEYDRMKSGLESITVFSQQGPFFDPKDYFLTSLDKENTAGLSHRHQGQRKLLRLFIKWFFEATSEDSGFVLTHPDFNLQNILVGEDGSLRGFVDWDGVVAVPQCVGPEEYPLWLTSDWDPQWWNYDTVGQCVKDEGRPAMSPPELQECRALYENSIVAAQYENAVRVTSLTTQTDELSGERPQNSRTKISSLARCLYISANEPLSLPSNVAMLFDRIVDLTAAERFENRTHDTTTLIDLSDHGIRMEEYEKLNSDDEVTNGQNPPGADHQEAASSSKDMDNFACALEEVAGDIESRPVCNFQAPIEATPAIVPLEDGPATDTKDSAAETSQIHFYQPDIWYRSSTSTTWEESLSNWATILSFFVLSGPAFFMLVMDYLQALYAFPIFASFAGFLVSKSSFASNLVALLLYGLCFAGIIDKTLQGPNVRKSHTRYREREASSAKIRNTGKSRNALEAADLRSSPIRLVSEIGPERSAKPLYSHNKIQRTSEEYNPDCSGSVYSGHDYSSNSDLDTEITEPSLGAISDDGHGGGGGAASVTNEERLQSIQNKWDEDPTHDFGHFTQRNVYNALYSGSLHGERMRRLKVGFQRLLASLDDRFADFDGLTLSD